MSVNPPLAQALRALAGRDRILVATDFDGVLAPLVEDPSTSRPVAGSMRMLREFAAMPSVFVAIVSGRQLAALRSLTGVKPSDDIVLIGSHGAEPDRKLPLDLIFDDAARARLARATAALQEVVAAHPPTRIEHKPHGVVLHTRGLPADVAQAATRDALAIAIPHVDVMQGKQMVEFTVLPVTKGIALQALTTQFGTDASIYFGDDVTDERAFEVLVRDPANVTIKVGAGDTLAQFRVDGPPNVVHALETLYAERHH
jgi:trehalose 6-phosphate phosphatase